MANPYTGGGAASKKNPYVAPASSEDRGPLGFTGNLVSDVKDTVVGLPMGLVETVRNPIKSVKAMGGAAWQTWSPLFQGDFAKFGKQVYDHPLAPLLDVATVFTLGAGGAARGANALSKAGVQSTKVEKVAGLARPKTVWLDETGRRAATKDALMDGAGGDFLPQPRYLSDKAGRRLMQELGMIAPQWYVKPRDKMRFNKLRAVEDAGKIKATHEIQMAALMQAGKVITDPETAPRALMEVAGGMVAGLHRHNDAVPVSEAERLVKTGNYNFTLDVRRLDPQTDRLIRRAKREERTWQRQREENAEMAHALPKIEKELAEANRELERMYRDGYRVVMPAKSGRRKEPTEIQKMEQEAAPILDVERRVKDLEKQLDRAHQAKAKHTKAVSEIERITDWRTQAEQHSYANYFRNVSTSLEDFVNFADNFGQRMGTKSIRKASRPKIIRDGRWVDDDTRVYVHRKHDAKMLGKEAANSASFLGKAYRKSSWLWKTVQLGYTIRTVTNNAVGNWVLAAARDDPVATAIGLYDAIRITKGPEAARETTLRATPFRKNHYMYRYFGDELGNTFKQTLADETGKMPGRLGQGIYPLVHKLSDEPVRMAVISSFLRRSPEVKALKKKGMSTDRAIQRALRKNPELRDRAAHHARTTAGDYYTMRPWERTVRDLMPFYLWNRHIVKTSANMVADTPGRVAIAQRLGSLGIEETEEILGELPEFLRGAIPLGKKGGRADVMLTNSLNPFATVADLVTALEGATTGQGQGGGSAVLSQANPFITGIIEAATGRSILTGAKKDSYGGVIPSVAVNTLMGFPQVRLGQALITPDSTETAAGNQRLYAQDDRSPLTSFLGVPLRNVSLEQAAAMAERDKPKRKKRRKNPYKS